VVEKADRIKHKPILLLCKGTSNSPLLSTSRSLPDHKSRSKPHLPPLKNSQVGHPLLKKDSYFTEITCPSGLILWFLLLWVVDSRETLVLPHSKTS